MSMSPRLPSVLQIPCKPRAGDPGASNSISVYRVLKTAIELLEQAEGLDEDVRMICLDDLEAMLKRVD